MAFPTPIFRGTLDPKLQKYTIQYSPTGGYNRTYDYRNFSEPLMQSLMTQWTNLGCEVTLTGAAGVFTLQVRDSTGEYVLDSWQIQQSDERVNCLQNPRHVGVITDDEKDIIRRYLDNPGLMSSPALGTAAMRLYRRMVEGATEFVRSVYILRHTTNAPSNWAANVADFNVDRIYTTAQLLNECQNTSFWLLPLPPAMAYFIDNIYYPTAPSAYYTNGWLKRGASRSTAANFRIELTTEYWSGQISNDEYSLATF